MSWTSARSKILQTKYKRPSRNIFCRIVNKDII